MSAAVWTAIWLYFNARYDAGRALHVRVEALAERFGDEPAVGAALAVLRACLATFSGDVSSACRQKEAAIRLFEQAGDQRNACRERTALGDTLYRLGAHVEAVALLRRALAEGERTSVDLSIGWAMNILALALTPLGALEEARAIAVEAIARGSAQGDVRLAGTTRIYLATILRLSRDLDSAEAEARRALYDLRGNETLQPLALATLAEVLLARGRPVEALASARRAAALLEKLGEIEEGEALVRLVFAEALAANQEQGAAAEAFAVARMHLLRHADKIADPAMRANFLQRVPENARTLGR